MRQFWILMAMVLGTAAVTFSGVAEVAEKPQAVVVHLSHFTNDLHRPFMAVKVANLMQKGGADVTLFLDLEGVRLADSRQSIELLWGPSQTPLSSHYHDFVKAGGKVVLCPHCAHAAAIESGDLREGSAIASEDQLAVLLLQANKVIDY